MAALWVSHFAPIVVAFYFIHLSSSPRLAVAVDVAQLLSQYRDLAKFTALLRNSSAAAALVNRSSLTVLAVPDLYLDRTDLTRFSSPSCSGDIIGNHILLQYLSQAELDRISLSGRLFATLNQAVGGAPQGFGTVNITRDAGGGKAVVRFAASTATVLANVTAVQNNVSVFTVDSLLEPCGDGLMSSETRPPLKVNIANTLMDGHVFNVAAGMVAAAGLVEEFDMEKNGAGLTLFMPVDSAFATAAPGLKSLSAPRKAVVMKYHVLHSYYPLGSLQSIVNPVQPTLATEEMGAGSYTLNITRINGSVVISTGIVVAAVIQTAFDQNPLAIFGVSRVLLPKEIFGKDGTPVGGGSGSEGAPPPVFVSLPPDNSPELYGPPSRVSFPPGIHEETGSAGATAPALHGFFSLAIAIFLALR